MAHDASTVKSGPGRILVLRFSFLPFLLLPVRLLVEELASRGRAVTLVKTRPRDTAVPEESPKGIRNTLLKLWMRRLPKSRLLEPLVYGEFLLRSVWHGLRTRPDLVIAVDVDTLLPAVVVARLCGARAIFYSLELYTERQGGFEPKWLWLWIERTFINRADLVVACEPNRARHMQEHYGARELPMVVLNVPKRTSRPESQVIRDELAAVGRPDAKILYYHGEISESRCASSFVDALARLPEAVVLYFVGPIKPGYQAQLEARAREAGVRDRVFFRGVISSEDLLEYAASADLGLQVQQNDGLNHYYCAPIKVFQYFSAGLPVIASDFPGMVEVVEKNGAGVCVAPGDIEALAAAIQQILFDEPLYRRMSARAFELSQTTYYYERESQRLFSAIERLLSKGVARQ